MYSRLKPLLCGLFFITIGCAGSQSSTQPQSRSQSQDPNTSTQALLKYQDEVTVDFLRDHLSAFAADSMMGRETGTKGLKMAADYLARQYRQMGLKPVGDNNTYFQHFDLNATKSDSVVFATYAGQDGQQQLLDRSVITKNSTANYIRAFGGTDTLSGDIVFAGFGIADSTHGVNQLSGLDLKGKWVMVFRRIPHVVDGDTLVDPAYDNRARFQTIFKHGAEGILLIPDMGPEKFKTTAEEAQANFGEASNMRLAYLDDGSGSSRGFNKGYNLINPELAARLLDVDSVQVAQQKVMESLSGFTPKSLGYSLTQTPYASEVSLETQNVAAFYEGADPQLKDEVVVMTSHYDHLGIGQPDSTGDRIYNGADDDGSGTIGVVNVAKAFVEAGKHGVKPRRSILFLNVAGEEKGLLGSHYYSDHPIFPIDKTVADINTDMIGRVDPKHKKQGIEEYTYIIGADIISSELDSLIRVANRHAGQLKLDERYNDLQDPNQFYRRSDHWHFGRKRIPFVFFFTGVHEDYHRPSDEVEKIRFDKMTKIVRTMYATAVEVANADKAPTVDNEEFIEITKKK